MPVLDVECLREDALVAEITKVPNSWTQATLTALLPEAVSRPSWTATISRAVSELRYLQITRELAIQEMSQYPYDQGASDRIFSILKRLNELAEARATSGDNSTSVLEWIRLNVASSGADFSSEQPKSESIFTFRDVESGKDLYCPWHGKVHNPLQYRIHYQWPIPVGQTRLKVLYIGQKLTKY